MKIIDIDHVEFYVGDAQQTAFYLCTAFGFRVCGQGGPETGLPDQRSLLLRQNGIQLLLTSGLTAGHPATGYVARHGDGVACIALRTDDPAASFAEAVERGATPVEQPREYSRGNAHAVTAVVSGFGDVAHRFIARSGSAQSGPAESGTAESGTAESGTAEFGAADEFLPGAIDMIAADPDAGAQLLQVLDHVAICLPGGELHNTVEYYRRVFGFAQIFEEYIEVGDQAMDSKVVQSPSGLVTFTLIEPDLSRQPGQIDGFLSAHGGAGVQHLAFSTEDILAAVPYLERAGVQFLQTPGSYYDGLAQRVGDPELPVEALRGANVLVDRDHWGQLYQIFTRSMHVRRTLFLELIERHGARTFGSGNIKALYQAVERERASASELRGA